MFLRFTFRSTLVLLSYNCHSASFFQGQLSIFIQKLIHLLVFFVTAEISVSPLSASPAPAVRDKEAPPGARRALPVKAQPPAPHPQPSKGPPTKPPHQLRTAAPTREGESDRHGGGQAREPLPGGARTRRLALGKTESGVGRLACSCPTRLQAQPRSQLANSSAVRAPHCASWPGDRAGYHVGGRGTVGRSF